MYAVPTLLRGLISTLFTLLRVLIRDYSGLLPGVAAPVAAMVALTRALLAMMMTRGVQMSLIL
ncbi:putative major facilitator superfamily domain-containing protein [Helianthus annuus]|nr:putative major facilitator superfamily domain-containing protein [Helianthus annuus]